MFAHAFRYGGNGNKDYLFVVKLRKIMVVSRKPMEEALKSLNVGAKVFSRRSNAMWDVLMATKTPTLQTDYMDFDCSTEGAYVHHG